MKNIAFAFGFSILLTSSSFIQDPIVIDLHKEAKNKRIEVYNRDMELIAEPSHMGIHLSPDVGEGVAWLKGVEFSNGVLEFDTRGQNIIGHSFVGIAFHGKDNATFDAIYLRPFRFQDSDEEQRSHALQYVSLPDNTWRVLRANHPGKFESAVNPAPDPNSWVHLRIVIQDATVTTYINGNKQPSLVFDKVSTTTGGGIGFYVADTSGGDFANLTITNQD